MQIAKPKELEASISKAKALTFTAKEKAELDGCGYTYNAIWKMEKNGVKGQFLKLLKRAAR